MQCLIASEIPHQKSPWCTLKSRFSGPFKVGSASGGAARDCTRRGPAIEMALSSFTMQRTSALHAVLLLVIALQLQPASGSPLTGSDNFAHAQIPVTASDLIKKAETFVKVFSFNL